jgi:hypothetical protein
MRRADPVTGGTGGRQARRGIRLTWDIAHEVAEQLAVLSEWGGRFTVPVATRVGGQRK